MSQDPEQNATLLSSLRRKRGTIQASITNFLKLIDEWKANPAILDYDYLNVSQEGLERTFKKFDAIQEELEELDENEVNKRFEVEGKYNLAISQARQLSRQQKDTTILPITNATTITPVQTTSMSVSLPQVQLPTFDGSLEDWTSFYDIFSSVIDNNDNLSPVRKLQYLRLSLKGRAATVIQSLETTDSNYKIAMDLLKMKFECKRKSTRRHWNILREYPRLNKDSSSNLNNLIDTFYQHTRALTNLGAPVDKWDIPLIDLILTKINHNTAWQWELTLTEDEEPKYTDLLKFLEKRANCSESREYDQGNNSNKSSNRNDVYNKNYHKSSAQQKQRVFNTTTLPSCPICKEPHRIYSCKRLKEASANQRWQLIQKAALCFNCLNYGHDVKQCKSGTCRICQEKHHTLLHKLPPIKDSNSLTSVTNKKETVITQETNLNPTASSYSPQGMTFVINTTSDIMASASVCVLDSNKQLIKGRALLDSCSTANLMTEKFANSLGLKTVDYVIPIGVVNGITTYTKHLISVTIKSIHNDYERSLSFLTVDEISPQIPSQPIDRSLIKIPSNLKLADPQFYKPAGIDLLINAGTTFSLICVGQVNLSTAGGPDLYLQKTRLGWVISGSLPKQIISTYHNCNFIGKAEFDLTKFWEIEEEFYKNRSYSITEEKCVNHYNSHTTRNHEGRYIVALPFNNKIQLLGNSKEMAERRLRGIERKFKSNKNFKEQYETTLNEYITLGHMSRVSESSEHSPGYYLPHHAVIKDSSLTTKLRVVFDGSAKSTTGVSLNDTLLVGPTIQSDIFVLLIRFRKHNIALTGDIEKMYRQVLVREEDRKYQRILWKNGDGKTQTYELNTVTFGLSSAPYLAIQTLHRLAEDENLNYPLAAKVLKQDFYVDDVLTGASSKIEAIKLRQQLTKLLQCGHFTIRQWASNDPDVLDKIPTHNINLQLTLGKLTTLKTLGIFWNPQSDNIVYTFQSNVNLSKITKRTVLSETAKIFDPLGLLSPVIIIAKIFLQRLWRLKLDWDESLPMTEQTE